MRLQSLILVGLAVLLVVLGVLLLRSDPAAADPEVAVGGPGLIDRQAGPAAPDVELATTGAGPEEERRAAAAAPALAEALAAEPASLEDHPWAAQLAGVVGRLVEVDGTPVSGMSIELLEVDVSTMLDPKHTALVREDVVIASARSDSDGRFHLGGARGSGFHGLLIDSGGGRAAVRFIDDSLDFGELTDLGDITLDAYGVVVGSVVDEDGEPVAGARVRLAPVPDIVVQSGVLDMREDSIVAGGEGDQVMVMELPGWVTRLSEKLPAATAFTDSEGAFRIEGVAYGRVVGGVDKPGYLATQMDPLDVNEKGGHGDGGAYDVGELELIFGRIVTGRAVDALGQPVAQAEVYAGALHPLLKVGFLQPGGVTAEDGGFEVVGVPEDGNVIGLARRSSHEPWTQVVALPGLDTLQFKFPARAAMEVLVSDEAGAPLEGASIVLTSHTDEGGMLARNLLDLPIERTPRPSTVSSSKPGVYVVPDVPLGRWTVDVKVDGFATARTKVEHGEVRTPVEVVCPRGFQVAVRVESAEGPVENAHVSVVGPSGFMMAALDSAWTDAEGRAVVGPVMEPGLPEGGFRMGPLEGLALLVEHPSFAVLQAELEHLQKAQPGAEIVIGLIAPGSVAGRVHWAGQPPPERYMVVLSRNGMGIDEIVAPQTAATGASGEFLFKKVDPGSYRVSVLPRFLNGNPLALLSMSVEPNEVFQGEVVVEAGLRATVDAALLADGSQAPGWFEGSVEIDGRSVAGAKVTMEAEETFVVFTDGSGQFRSEELDAGRGYWVTIHAPAAGAQPGEGEQELFSDWINVPSGGAARIDVAIDFLAVEVEVVDGATGEPVAGALVSPAGGEEVSTDADGLARLSVKRSKGDGPAVSSAPLALDGLAFAGDETLSVFADGYRNLSELIDWGQVEAGRRITLKLSASIPCAGRVVLPQQSENEWVVFAKRDADDYAGEWIQIDEEDFSFSTDELEAGEYKAVLWSDDGESLKVEFVLPEGGDTGLVIDFTAAR